MPICTSCGQNNPDIAKFCLACGAALAEPEPAPEEERKVVTALFTDIVGSTASAEQMDPEDVRARLAPYYARARTELESFGGTVEKFIGDAVVALFGAPVAHEDDPERAVRAALAIRSAVEELNASDEWLDIHLRTAVHTGEALVVLGASAVEGEGMAAGDVMNTAARLQSGAPVDGIVVGEATFRATSTLFEYREAEPVQAKGKTEPIPIWEVISEKEAPERPTAGTPLVGRSTELAFLSDLWTKATEETRPQLVTLLGPPGIGKSRLLLALSELAERDGAAYWGRCLPYGEGITYWPVTEILKSATGIRHDDDQARISDKLGALLENLPTDDQDELRTMAAAAANLLGVATTPLATYSAEEISQAELHWGIRRVLQLLATGRPLLLVFEDLHWAEPTLLEFIRTLAELENQSPMLLIGSARPELRDSSPAMVTTDGNRSLLELAPLGEDESRALLVELVGDEAIAVQLETLLQNAGGNPLFLEETVRMVADAKLDPDVSLDALPVPDNLQALIGSRLDALHAGDKRVAQQASVVGGVFWQGAVAHLDGSSGDLTGSLATLERRDFVQAQNESTVAGDRQYAFKHILIRDVAYERLPKGRRAELHVRFTDWVSALPGPETEFVEIVAYHLEQACHFARQIARSPIEPPILDATAALSRAAEKAERRESIREADRYYVRALELVGPEHAEAEIELRLQRGRTLAGLGDLRQACEELVATAEGALGVSRRDLRGEALVTLANIDQRQGRASEARGRLAEAEAIVDELADRLLQIKVMYSVAALKSDFDGAHTAAVEQLRGGLRIAEEVDDRRLRIEGHLRLGTLFFNTGQFTAAEQELRRCLELASQLGSHRDEARGTFFLGYVTYYRGEFAEAERLNLQAREWLERTGETYFQIQNSLALASYALARGDSEGAERWVLEVLPLAHEEGGWLLVKAYRHLVEALARQGRIADAAALAEFAGRSVPEEDALARADVLLGDGAVAAAQGTESEVRERYAAAIRLLDGQDVPVMVAGARADLARALARLGATDEARAHFREARETFMGMDAHGPVAQIDHDLAVLTSGAGVAGPAPSA